MQREDIYAVRLAEGAVDYEAMVDQLAVAARHVQDVGIYNGNVAGANRIAFGSAFEISLARNKAEQLDVFVPVRHYSF